MMLHYNGPKQDELAQTPGLQEYISTCRSCKSPPDLTKWAKTADAEDPRLGEVDIPKQSRRKAQYVKGLLDTATSLKVSPRKIQTARIWGNDLATQLHAINHQSQATLAQDLYKEREEELASCGDMTLTEWGPTCIEAYQQFKKDLRRKIAPGPSDGQSPTADLIEEELARTLYVLGQLLSTKGRIRRFPQPLMHEPSGCGKTTLMEFLTEVIGPKNTYQMKTMSGQFELDAFENVQNKPRAVWLVPEFDGSFLRSLQPSNMKLALEGRIETKAPIKHSSAMKKIDWTGYVLMQGQYTMQDACQQSNFTPQDTDAFVNRVYQIPMCASNEFTYEFEYKDPQKVRTYMAIKRAHLEKADTHALKPTSYTRLVDQMYDSITELTLQGERMTTAIEVLTQSEEPIPPDMYPPTSPLTQEPINPMR